MSFDNLKTRALKVKDRVNYIKTSLEEDLEAKKDYEQSKIKYDENIITLLKTSQVLKNLTDIMTLEKIKQLRELLSSAVKAIFDDRDFDIDIDIKELRGTKSAEFILIENIEQNGKKITRRNSIKNAVGGGVVCIVGFIAQIYEIKRKGLAPILFMDEALSQLSKDYVPNLMRFINRIAEKEGFIFILITHDTRFMDFSKNSYKVEFGEYTKVKYLEVDEFEN